MSIRKRTFSFTCSSPLTYIHIFCLLFTLLDLPAILSYTVLPLTTNKISALCIGHIYYRIVGFTLNFDPQALTNKNSEWLVLSDTNLQGLQHHAISDVVVWVTVVSVRTNAATQKLPRFQDYSNGVLTNTTGSAHTNVESCLRVWKETFPPAGQFREEIFSLFFPLFKASIHSCTTSCLIKNNEPNHLSGTQLVLWERQCESLGHWPQTATL